jgi:hypothetical protein
VRAEGGRQTAGGRRQVADGRWQVADGRWQTAGGKEQERAFSIFHYFSSLVIRAIATRLDVAADLTSPQKRTK